MHKVLRVRWIQGAATDFADLVTRSSNPLYR